MPPAIAAGCGPWLLTDVFSPVPAGRLSVVEANEDDELGEAEEANEAAEVGGTVGVGEANVLDGANRAEEADGANESDTIDRVTAGGVEGCAYRGISEDHTPSQARLLLTGSGIWDSGPVSHRPFESLVDLLASKPVAPRQSHLASTTGKREAHACLNVQDPVNVAMCRRAVTAIGRHQVSNPCRRANDGYHTHCSFPCSAEDEGTW